MHYNRFYLISCFLDKCSYFTANTSRILQMKNAKQKKYLLNIYLFLKKDPSIQ